VEEIRDVPDRSASRRAATRRAGDQAGAMLLPIAAAQRFKARAWRRSRSFIRPCARQACDNRLHARQHAALPHGDLDLGTQHVSQREVRVAGEHLVDDRHRIAAVAVERA
jgi:hypothetical protein